MKTTRFVIAVTIAVLIITLAGLLATMFAIPILLFLLLFLLVFVKPAQYEINRIKSSLGLNEDQAIVFIITIPILTYLLLSTITSGLLMTKPDYIQNYELAITPKNQSLDVRETLVYHISKGNGIQSLKRVIETKNEIENARVICPYGETEPKIEKTREGLVFSCLVNGRISPGMHIMEILYTIKNPYACYETKCLATLTSRFDMDVMNAKIDIIGKEAQLYGAPAIRKGLIKHIRPGELWELNLVVDKAGITGIETNLPDSVLKAHKNLYTPFYILSEHGNLLGLGAILLASLLVLVIYLLLGREKTFKDVPHVVKEPLLNRKPYEINLLYHGDPDKIDDDGILATILDLARRGYFEIDGNKVKIIKRDTIKLDEYEEKIYRTYALLAKHIKSRGILDFGKLQRKVRRSEDIQWIRWVRETLEDLYQPPNIPNAFTKKGKYLAYIIFFVLIGIGFFSTQIVLDIPSDVMVGYNLLASGFSGVMAILVFDVYALGRYKKTYAKERRIWDSFCRFMRDDVALRASLPRDKEKLSHLLTYSTALDCSSNLLDILDEEKIDLPNMHDPDYYMITPIVIISLAKTRESELPISEVLEEIR